jgi:hypothetical protein
MPVPKVAIDKYGYFPRGENEVWAAVNPRVSPPSGYPIGA